MTEGESYFKRDCAQTSEFVRYWLAEHARRAKRQRVVLVIFLAGCLLVFAWSVWQLIAVLA